MHRAAPSWPPPRDASFAAKELHSTTYASGSSSCGSSVSVQPAPPLSTLQRQSRSEATRARPLYASAAPLHVGEPARLVAKRDRAAVLADLQHIRAEANTAVVDRWFLRWALCAVRRAALRRVQDSTRRMLWQRVGARCFAWWRLVTERRMCREMLYQEAAARERVLIVDGVCRGAWQRWRQWAHTRAVCRARATRLGLINRQRHAISRFRAWTYHPQRCRQLRAVVQIRFAAERSLARFVLVQWRLHTLQGCLLFPLQVRVAHEVAVAAFRRWQHRAHVMARLHALRFEGLERLARRCVDRWKRWLRRRLQAALLQQTNEARLQLRVLSKWRWRHELHALKYEECAAPHRVSRLFS